MTKNMMTVADQKLATRERAIAIRAAQTTVMMRQPVIMLRKN